MRPFVILATAFEPFAGRRINSSERFLDSVEGAGLSSGGEYLVERRILPVTWASAVPTLHRYVEGLRPDLIVAFGEGGGKRLRIESLAHNEIRGKVPDNDGACPADASIDSTEASVLTAPWSAERIVCELNTRELNVELSAHAGSYLCNRVLFELGQRGRSGERPWRNSGFVHVPVNFELEFANRAALGQYSTFFMQNLLSQLLVETR